MDVVMTSETGGRGEQLSSLALRCAERISVPFRDFYRELVVPILYEGRAVPKGKGLPVNGAIDGTLEAAEAWVTVMNRLTGRSDLQRTTLLAWRHCLAPRKLARTHRAWCPACLHEFARRGDLVYEPLVWRVEEVAVCPTHRVRLESECPHCGRGRQPSFAAYTRVGCCRKCSKWLGQPLATLVPTSGGDFEIFCARSVEDAIALSNVGHNVDLVASDVAVRAIRDVFYEGSAVQMGRALGVLPSQVVHFAAGTFPAPLHLFVRACYATGATMRQIFLTNSFEGDSLATRECEFELRRSVPRRVQMSRDLVDRLTKAIAGNGGTSIKDIAHDLNISATTVWRRERELASRLARHHAEYVAKETQCQKDQYRRDVVAFLTTCRADRICLGRRRIDEECGGVGRFGSDWKRSVIKEARAEVFGSIPAATDQADDAH